MNVAIAIAQTKQNLVNVLNDSQLPLCILSEILHNITMEVQLKAQEEFNQEIQKQKEEESKPTESSEV